MYNYLYIITYAYVTLRNNTFIFIYKCRFIYILYINADYIYINIAYAKYNYIGTITHMYA